MSAEESTETFDIVKPSKARWASMFSQKNHEHNQLCDLLNEYTKFGVPVLDCAVLESPDEDRDWLRYLFEQDNSWHKYVEVADMDELDIKYQSAVWELVVTEIEYIHSIRTIVNVSSWFGYA